MSTDERQLSRALHTYAEGTTVTTADVEALRARMYQRVIQQNRRRSRARWLVAAATTVVVLAGGQMAVHRLDEPPAPPAPPAHNPTRAVEVLPLTAHNLAGIWRVEGGDGSLWRFSPKGTVAVRGEGRLGADKPSFAARYKISGTTVRFVSLERVPCRGWTMTIQIRIDGTMTQTFTKEAATCRFLSGNTILPGVQFELTRVSPASFAGVALRGIPDASKTRPTSLLGISGIWLVEGTGRLVRLTAGGSAVHGTYAIDDDGDLDSAPDDAGTVSLGTDGTLTFTTSSGSAGCPPGSQFAMHGLSVSPDLLTGSLTGQSCQQRGDLRGGWAGVSLLGRPY